MSKRVFDVIVSLFLLATLLPLFLLIALFVKKQLGSPVLFLQTRPGRGGKPFTIFKFRTMRDAVDPTSGQPLPNNERITPLGSFLRRTSLDELPELLNVLRGEMSLVGPRPLLMEYLPLYSTRQARRHEVRPGITGWAQVNGRNAIDWETKFEMDVWYVNHQSFWLDLKILWLTIQTVFSCRDVNHSSLVTMPKFKGTPYSEL